MEFTCHGYKLNFSRNPVFIIVNRVFGKVNEKKNRGGLICSHTHTCSQPHRLPRASQFHNVLLGKPLENSFASNLSGGFFFGRVGGDRRLNRLNNGEENELQAGTVAPPQRTIHTCPTETEYTHTHPAVLILGPQIAKCCPPPHPTPNAVKKKRSGSGML